MKKMSFINFFIAFFVFLFCIFSCTGSQHSQSQTAEVIVFFPGDESSEFVQAEPAQEEPSYPRVTYLDIVAVGDNLVHHPIFQASYTDGSYSFHYIFDHIRDYILSSDIAFINQETIFGNEELGFSGYPRFSTPPEMGTAVVAAGFNIINFANNHALDRGAEGIMSSIGYLDNYDHVFHLGIHRNREERTNRHVILDMNNITVGFLAYTFSVNGIAFPAGRDYLVSMIDRDIMAAEINALRPLVDYLIVSMHWGEEYALRQNRGQSDLAALFAELGVDLVIGHHPHVLQPMEIITRPDGRPMPVFYSLGNFLSSHSRTTKEALLGGIMYLRISRTEYLDNISLDESIQEINREINIEEIGLIPVITHFDIDRNNFGIYPLHEYTDELASLHWRSNFGSGDPEMDLEFFHNLAEEIFGSDLLLQSVSF